MSDCFDHAADAAYDYCEGRTWYDGRRSESLPTKKIPKDIQCKYCREHGFNWIFYENKWRLYDPDNEELHICEKYKTAPQLSEQGGEK